VADPTRLPRKRSDRYWTSTGDSCTLRQAMMEAVLEALIKGQRNPSLDSMNTVGGKLELAEPRHPESAHRRRV
jgi:hypothetical protein